MLRVAVGALVRRSLLEPAVVGLQDREVADQAHELGHEAAVADDDVGAGKAVADKSCANTIAGQYQLGQTFGVRGTPALVLEDGTMQPGYLPPKKLAALLNGKKPS